MQRGGVLYHSVAKYIVSDVAATHVETAQRAAVAVGATCIAWEGGVYLQDEVA